ncbi:MAG: hypothetical protein CMD48_04355 [Gammaproteobacteria bacterium]|jgi:hypothetical protein|nr:hypothetical protein [Gammaproteobacteria bacterium]|tara:strand:+ start:700 stop:1176 length:477 start_codon:yes stop_codon:yes gene_type:complete
MESNQLLEIIYLLEDSYIGEYVRSSLWLFPVIQSFHLIGLGILGGAVVVGDLRLMGILMRTESTRYVIRVTRPWFNFGLFILIITGIPLFLSEAVKCYYSRAFWIKISCLLLGALFVYFIRNPIVLSKDENFMIKILGFISFSLWVVTAASGRWIGFS